MGGMSGVGKNSKVPGVDDRLRNHCNMYDGGRGNGEEKEACYIDSSMIGSMSSLMVYRDRGKYMPTGLGTWAVLYNILGLLGLHGLHV